MAIYKRNTVLIFLAVALFAMPSAQAKQDFIIQPYYVYPKDQPRISGYESAINRSMQEVQQWYDKQVGKQFKIAPVKVVRSDEKYLTMRCGKSADTECKKNMHILPNWLNAMSKAVGGFKEQTGTVIFSQGGGGWAGANVNGNYAGFAVVGDWVLEPISGKANHDGIPCKYATWQCKGGTPVGTIAHEIGHIFGLPHPDNYKGPSIMKGHTEYPNVGFLPHELELLKQSPFFSD